MRKGGISDLRTMPVNIQDMLRDRSLSTRPSKPTEVNRIDGGANHYYTGHKSPDDYNKLDKLFHDQN